MKTVTLYLLAFSGGVFLAIQAGFNSRLSSILKEPVVASVSTSVFSVLFAGAFLILAGKEWPNLHQARQIPWYLWGIGGLFSVLGISLYFYTIPRLGISRMIALGLCGQLLFSLFAGQFGWLSLPYEPITLKRFLGAAAMILGIILINTK